MTCPPKMGRACTFKCKGLRVSRLTRATSLPGCSHIQLAPSPSGTCPPEVTWWGLMPLGQDRDHTLGGGDVQVLRSSGALGESAGGVLWPSTWALKSHLVCPGLTTHLLWGRQEVTASFQPQCPQLWCGNSDPSPGRLSGQLSQKSTVEAQHSPDAQ